MSFIRSTAKIFVPRIVKASRPQSSTAVINPNKDLVQNPTEWWEKAKYSKVERPRRMEWLGLKLQLPSYQRSIKDSYLRPADDLVKVIIEMQESGVIPPLSKESRIFEPGCNVGRNLLYLRKKFGSEVVGIDISREAIDIAVNDVWKNSDRVNFMVDNVLTSSYYESIGDDWFDLCITRWLLVAIPKSEQKANFLEQLKRISRTLVILEPFQEERQGTIEYYHGGDYCFSHDNWEEDYGLKAFETSLPLGGHTRVFYSSKSSEKSSD